jgi:hypothetical protein
LPKATAAVHRQRDFEKLAKTGARSVITLIHLSDDSSELLEVRSLRREKRDTLKERNDGFKERASLANDKHKRAILLAIRLEIATPESITN